MLAVVLTLHLNSHVSGQDSAATKPTSMPDQVGRNDTPALFANREDSIFEYLLMRYDADKNGIVSRREYTREERTFRRLDHNRDGRITRVDFTGRGGQPGRENMQTRMRHIRSRRTLASYFQNDTAADTLTLEEVQAAFAHFDENKDAILSDREFTARADKRYVELPGADSQLMRVLRRGVELWGALCAAIDANENDNLSLDEVVTFFINHDPGDGVWQILAPEETTASHRQIDEHGEPQGGPTVGTVAPDFKLSPPDGGAMVALSSFKGHKPVALIFGSYT